MLEDFHLMALESGNTPLVLIKLHHKPLKTPAIKFLLLY